jgi:hypothetical protein
LLRHESLGRSPIVDSSEVWGISLETPNLSPEWIIAGPDDESGNRSKSHERLLDAARSAWPNILSFARLADVRDSESLA